MAQQFTKDSQMLAAAVSLVTNAETNGPQTNALRVPYQNGKFAISGTALIQTGTGVTGVQVRVRRNSNNENVVLNPVVQTIAAAASTIVTVAVDFTDAVPDGRDCVYTMTVQQVGATGNGNILAGSTLHAVALSG